MTVDDDAIMDVLETIPDPEMPISIVQLGLVERVAIDDRAHVTIDILPTFVGCPALDMIRGDIEAKVGALDGVAHVAVNFVYDPPWSVDRITTAGRADLRAHGVTVPERGSSTDVPGHGVGRGHGQGLEQGTGGNVELRMSAIACPFCDSSSVRLDSPFGPTRCRMIFYCSACRNSFEHMKKV